VNAFAGKEPGEKIGTKSYPPPLRHAAARERDERGGRGFSNSARETGTARTTPENFSAIRSSKKRAGAEVVAENGIEGLKRKIQKEPSRWAIGRIYEKPWGPRA